MEEQDVSALINRKNASGSTLLHQAFRRNFPERALMLMRKGAIVQYNGQGEMPINSLVKFLEEGEMKAFLEKLDSEQDVSDLINRMNARGSTLLHQACINNSPEKAALLMKKGAVVQRNRKGETPSVTLMKCFEEGEVREFLGKLQAEVDVSEFINEGIKHFSLRSDWKSGLKLHALGASPHQNKEVEEVLMEFGRGIQHVVEATDLQPLFEAWASPSEKEKEAAEQKINDFFSETLNVLFIPADEVEDSKREELRTILKEWNSLHDNKGKEESFLEIFLCYNVLFMTLISSSYQC